MAFRVCWNMSCFNWFWEGWSNFEPVELLDNKETYTPGVSTTVTIPPKILNSLLSRVIPYSLSTIANLSPIRQLNRLLLPQFGNPTNDTINFSFFYFIVDHYFYFLLFFVL